MPEPPILDGALTPHEPPGAGDRAKREASKLDAADAPHELPPENGLESPGDVLRQPESPVSKTAVAVTTKSVVKRLMIFLTNTNGDFYSYRQRNHTLFAGHHSFLSFL